MLCFKSISADGSVWLHHKSTGKYEVDLTSSDFYELIDVISVEGHIESLQWRIYKGKEDLPSLITKHLGKNPVFFQHLVPRYYITTVVAPYKRKKKDAINETSSLKRRNKKANAGLVIYKYGKCAHAKEYEYETTFCIGYLMRMVLLDWFRGNLLLSNFVSLSLLLVTKTVMLMI